MRAVLQVEPYTAERLGELVSARLERQSVIGRAYLTAVIDQHVLQRPVGTPAIMAEQYGHLAIMAGRPDIGLHVVPEGTNVGLWGAFDIGAALPRAESLALIRTMEEQWKTRI